MKRYTKQEFSDLTGVPVNTLTKWNYEQRLIPAENSGQGKQAYYTAEQLQAPAITNYKLHMATKQEEPSLVEIIAEPLKEKSLERLADEVTLYTLRGNEAIVRSLAFYIAAGARLNEAKSRLAHGQWQNWLADNFPASPDTANNYMKLAERFADKADSETFKNIKPSTAIKLLNVPQGDEETFIAAQAAAGRPVEIQSAREIQRNIKEWKRSKGNSETSKSKKSETFRILKPEKPAIMPNPISPKASEDISVPTFIDVDAVITPVDAPIQAVDSENDSDSATGIEPVADETADVLIDSELNDDIRPIVGVEITKSELEAFTFVASIEEVGTLHRLRELIDNRIEALASLGITESDPPAAIAKPDDSDDDEYEDEGVFDKLTPFTQRFNIYGEIAIFEDGKLRRIESPKYNTTFYCGDRPFWYVVDTKISSQTVYSEDKFFALLARCGACTIDSPDNSELDAKK